ncbi:MAG: hypothetical protein HN542_05285 [Flavobacteriales bacterium]|nr:hypothetical protein [Flavobacteriales bacterium]NCG29666.1 hypothetical protein [Bacteroidota bacterium]MBT3963179.1 hypothetical protein [Flavobacteriales bacterium]MBT4705641.1 hypothetical protein [Flavobacteriales bacterium]MBT4930917.1 hypothetical protein [Flavobacteriales bacterium]
MFTTGRIIFAVFFLVAFAAFLIWAYVKDARLQKQYFKGTGYIFLILTALWFIFYFFVKLT